MIVLHCKKALVFDGVTALSTARHPYFVVMVDSCERRCVSRKNPRYAMKNPTRCSCGALVALPLAGEVSPMASGDRAPTASVRAAYTPWSTFAWSEQKVVADDGVADADFAYAVSIAGDTAVIGAPCSGAGEAYVYTRTAGVWTVQQILTADDGVAADGFGFSVGRRSDHRCAVRDDRRQRWRGCRLSLHAHGGCLHAGPEAGPRRRHVQLQFRLVGRAERGDGAGVHAGCAGRRQRAAGQGVCVQR